MPTAKVPIDLVKQRRLCGNAGARSNKQDCMVDFSGSQTSYFCRNFIKIRT